MKVDKRKDVKPALKKSEQTRHQTAAQYFLAGAQPFLIEQEIQIRKYVNTDILKDNIVKECKKKFEVMKQNLDERVDEVRKKATNEFDKVLNGLLLMGGAAIIALNKLSPQLIETTKKHGSVVYDRLKEELDQILVESYGLADAAQAEANQYIKYIGKVLFNYIDIFFNVMENNVFVDFINASAIAAGKRANGALWLLLKTFGSFVHNEVRKRPDLEEFLKFGPKVVREINDFELNFREVTLSVAAGEAMVKHEYFYDTMMSTSGTWIRGAQRVRQVRLSSSESDVVRTSLQMLDERVLNISKNIANELNVNSVFSQLGNSILRNKTYLATKAMLRQEATTQRDAARWFTGDVSLAEMSFEKDPEVYTEAFAKIQRYIRDNRDRFDDGYLMIKSEFENLMKVSTIERFYLIRWILYAVIMDQRKQELYKITMGSLEQQNYRTDTFLNRTLEKVRSTNASHESQIDTIISDMKEGRIEAEQFASKIDQILAEYEVATDEQGNITSTNYKIFKNLINRNDVRATFTPYRIINQINLLRTSIQKASQVQQGAESSMIHNMNEYGLGGYRASEFDNDGRIYEHNRELHTERNQIIPIQEANERLTEEYIILRQNIVAGRRRRKELISKFLELVEKLKDIRIELEQPSAS